MLLYVCVDEQNGWVVFVSFYDVFINACKEKGVRPSRAAEECGINRSNVSNWKNNGYTPRGEALQKIADYFGVTTDYLLTGEEKEKAPAEAGERAINTDDIKIALFGGDGEVTDAMWDEALFAVQLIKERHKREKERNG